MLTRRLWLAAAGLLVAALLLAACDSSQSAAEQQATPDLGPAALLSLPKNSGGYADISAQQLASLMKNKQFTLVNVHVPYEGEIAGTDLLIAYNEIGANLDKLPAKDAPIVLYCRSGNMSTTAAEELVRLGYTNVTELEGDSIAGRPPGTSW